MGNIIYPGMLVLLAILALVGLGLFQRLSQNVTAAVPPDHDEGEEEERGGSRKGRESISRKARGTPLVSGEG